MDHGMTSTESRVSMVMDVDLRALHEHNIDYPYNCKFGQAKRQKFYVVALGKHPGIFLTWLKAKWLVHEYGRAKFEVFKFVDLAKLYL